MIGGGFLVLNDGNNVSSNVSSVNQTYTTANVEITRTDNDTVSSVFPNGVTVAITVTVGVPNFVLTLPQSFQDSTQGLLGNYNNDDSDDFIYPNGTMISGNSSDRMIHDFGQACKSYFVKIM